MEKIRLPPDLFLEMVDIELPYHLIKLGRWKEAESADFVEMAYDGERLVVEAVKGDERILLGIADKKRMERVEELKKKGLLKATGYRGSPEGRFLCPLCGDPVSEGWQYYVGHYYHRECFLKHYRKFW